MEESGLEEGRGHNIKVHDLRGISHDEVYDQIQSNPEITDGDVIVADGATAFVCNDSPILVAGNSHAFQEQNKMIDWSFAYGGAYEESEMAAQDAAAENGIGSDFQDTQPGVRQMGGLDEKAPPGMEAMVMKLKKQYPDDHSKAFATAWSIYNKKHGKTNEGYGDLTWDEVESAFALAHQAVANGDPNKNELLKQADALNRKYEFQQTKEFHGRGNPVSKIVPESHVDTCRQSNKAIARKACKMEESYDVDIDYATRRVSDLINSFVEADRAFEIVTEELSQQGYESDEIKLMLTKIDEDLNNGYYKRHVARGADYFPSGADSAVVKKVGPSGARHGDNPEQKFMQIAETHKELVYKYRAFLKESAPASPKKRLVEAAQVADFEVIDINKSPDASTDSITFDGTISMSATVINREGNAIPIGYDADVVASSVVEWETNERDVRGPAGPESDTYETYEYATSGPIVVSAASFSHSGVYLYDNEEVSLDQLREYIDDEVLKQLLAPEIYVNALAQSFDDAAEKLEPDDNSDDFNEPDYDDYGDNDIDDSNYGRFR
jgi:hypothetical protein